MTIDDKNTIDGASLLRSEDLKNPDEKDLKADCGTGKEKKKRACANCTCGLGKFLTQIHFASGLFLIITIFSGRNRAKRCSIRRTTSRTKICLWVVLSRRCFPLCQLPVSRKARIQARREAFSRHA